MHIAIFGKNFDDGFTNSIEEFFSIINGFAYKISIYKPFHTFIKDRYKLDINPDHFFQKPFVKEDGIDMMFSIGGDGTFLESISFVGKLDIPIAGINSGRLGFLANISQEEIPIALQAIHDKRYTLEERTLLEVDSGGKAFKHFNYALNELTIQKRDTGSMIVMNVKINGEFVNTYWADGIILSTPTGSTAYSLSLGGPIVVPGSENFILTPIAPHSLTVRPIIIPDHDVIEITVEGRTDNYLASLDHQSEVVEKYTVLKVKAADFKIKTVRIEGKTFFDTIRDKLMWGVDRRN